MHTHTLDEFEGKYIPTKAPILKQLISLANCNSNKIAYLHLSHFIKPPFKSFLCLFLVHVYS